MTRTHSSVLLSLAVALAGAFACNTGEVASPGAPPPAPSATPENGQGDPPSVYVAKVKNVLVGLPPSDDEIAAVESDPQKLADLVDGWMKTPEYDAKMRTFFELAFQQTQVTITDFADQAYPRQADVNGFTAPLLVQNARESFARTMLALIAQGRPFTDAMTTTQLMMTPALMELYAFLDAWQVDDAGKVTDTFKQQNPTASISVTAQGPIPIEQTLDPNSPNYMHWYDPDVSTYGTNQPAGCATDPIVYPASAITLHFLLLGSLDNRKNPQAGGMPCQQRGGTAQAPQLTASDFSTWKMVTIKQTADPTKATRFYDLPTLRNGSELVLRVPRVGFFSTPAFFANWQTNTSNQMRVTINQTLIVATGAAVDGTDSTDPPSTPGLDAVHAADPACEFCHKTLDPTRSILASAYSWNYHTQTEAAYAQQKGLFAFQGVTKPVGSVAEFGQTLASHPLLPAAWAEKLCYYVNSAPCSPDDPELQRVVGDFQSSGFQWGTLVRELLSSPLVTNAKPTKQNPGGADVIAVARRDHLCAALNNRLGFTDVCALDPASRVSPSSTIAEIVSGLPSDGYGRGSIAPVLPNEPSLFYRAGLENICAAVAAQTIDAANPAPNVKRWSSAQPDAAMDDFVHIVMGLTTGDPRASDARAILASHFSDAKAQGVSPSDALRSTFVVACLAPSTISIGL